MLSFYSSLNSRNQTYFDIGIIFLASIIITIPLFIYGIPGGVDLFQHIQFGHNYFESIKAGTFYPSWADQPNYGYGDVGVRFYPPLTYYFFSLFRLIAGNWADAQHLMIIFSFFVSGIGFYLWTREFFSQRSALIGALTYMILPYHCMQIYQFAFLAEFLTASILPFCFLFVTRVCRQGRMIDICGLAISFGLVILSHLPTTIMLSVTLLIYSLFSLKKENYVSTLFKLATSVLISILLSSFYWVRMVTELDWVNHNSDTYRTEYFFYKSNFIFARFFEFTQGDHAASIRFELIFLITLGILISHLIIFFVKPRTQEHLPKVGMFVITIFVIFMITPLSAKVWELLPSLQKIQFPWRWLILLSLGCAFFVADGFEYALTNLKTSKRHLAVLALGMLLICIPVNLLRVMWHYSYYPKDYLIPVAERFKINPSYVCWWTIWATKDIWENNKSGMPKPDMIADKVVLNKRPFTISNWAAADRNFTIQAGEAGQAQIATLWYPHWKAEVNGQTVEVTRTEWGLISFPVPAEESEIRLYFQEPQFVINTFYLAGFSWIIMFCFLLFYSFQKLKNLNIPQSD